MFRPVAVIMMSASSSSPESSLIPLLVNSLIVSVTTEAFPLFMAWNMSPFGTKHSR